MGKSPEYERAWEKYRQFALTSRGLKADWERWQTLFLWLTLVGTVSAAVGAQSIVPLPADWARAFGFLGAAAVAIGAYFSKEGYSSSREREWTKARAIGEDIKSDIFRFATGTPFEDGKSSESDLLEKANEHAKRFEATHKLLASDGKGSPPAPMSLDQYVEERLEDQRKYYAGAMEKAKAGHAVFRGVQLGLGLLVVVLGIMTGFSSYSEKINALIVLVSAIAGIFAAYAAVARYDYLQKSYASLNHRMGDLIAKARAASDTNLFIAQCEAELSAEHRSWLAEWQNQPKLEKAAGATP